MTTTKCNKINEKLAALFAYIQKYSLILTYDSYKKQWVILEAEHLEGVTEHEKADSLEELAATLNCKI